MTFRSIGELAGLVMQRVEDQREGLLGGQAGSHSSAKILQFIGGERPAEKMAGAEAPARVTTTREEETPHGFLSPASHARRSMATVRAAAKERPHAPAVVIDLHVYRAGGGHAASNTIFGLTVTAKA